MGIFISCFVETQNKIGTCIKIMENKIKMFWEESNE